jgi:hypothetical protein
VMVFVNGIYALSDSGLRNDPDTSRRTSAR